MLPAQAPQQEEKKKNLGFFRGALEAVTDVGPLLKGFVEAMPSFVQNAWETAESVAQLKTGVGAPRIVKESAEDYKTAKEAGAKGPDLFQATLTDRFPLAAEMGPSIYRSRRALEPLLQPGVVGKSLGLKGLDTGEQGIDYARGFREGNLTEMLFEDLGNIMLLGRGAGLGSVAARGGTRLAQAGSPRLGRFVEGVGYVAEQPIAASIRGTAAGAGRLASVVSRTPEGRLANLGQAARAVAGSETPIRAAGQQALQGKRTFFAGRSQTLQTKLNNINDEITEKRLRGEDTGKLEQRRKNIEASQTYAIRQTGQERMAKRVTKESMISAENIERSFVQDYGRYESLGPVPEAPKDLYASAVSLRSQAENADNPVRKQQLLDASDSVERARQAKLADTEGRMTDPEFIKTAFGAAVLIASKNINAVRGLLASGELTLPQAVRRLIPDELPRYIAEQGYDITPEVVKMAEDMLNGNIDQVGYVSIEQALSIMKRFSDMTTEARRTGAGQIRGAASQFEAGSFPLPQYLVKEFDNVSPETRVFVFGYLSRMLKEGIDEAVANQGDQVIDELGIRDVPQDKLFETMATSTIDSPPYVWAYESIVFLIEDLATGLKQELLPDGQMPRPDLMLDVREALANRMIYPAPMRISMATQERTIRSARAEDVQTMATGLQTLLDENPDVFAGNLLNSIKSALDKAAGQFERYDKDTWRNVRGAVANAIKALEKKRQDTANQTGLLDEARQQALFRLEQIETTLRTTQQFVENLVRNPEQFFPTDTPEVARLRGVASEAQAGLEALGEPGRAERPFRPQTELEANTRQLEQQKSEIATEVQQVEREIYVAERRLAEAESLTPEDIELLKTERGLAEVVETENPYEQITTAQAKAELKKRLDDVRERIREEDKALRDATVTFMRTGLTEDLKASIDEGLGAGRPRALYEAFVRRFTKPKPPPGFNVTQLQGRPNPYSDLPWDSAGDAMARNFNLTEVDGLSGITEAARRFKRLQDLKAELADLRKVEKSPDFLEDFRKEFEDELNSQVDDYRESQYREVDLTSPEGFTRTADDYNRILNDAQNPDLLRLNLETLRGRVRSLQDQIRQIDQTIADNASDVQRRIFENESLRLRGVERRATQEAEGLVSANLETQARVTRGMLRGVGAVREGQPVLQRQFAGPLEQERARLEQREQTTKAKIDELRQRHLEEDARLRQAQQVPEQATALGQQLEKPMLPLELDESPMYIPAGPSRYVLEQASVNKQLGEGIAPEQVGGMEKIRTGTILPMTPGQMMARVREIMETLGRNITMQNLVTNREFVTTVADHFKPEELNSMRQEAEALHANDTDIGSRGHADKVNKDFGAILFRAIERKGLEPISTEGMPDPNDIYTPREALGDLLKPVPSDSITPDTMLMTKGLRQAVSAEFTSRSSPQALSMVFDKVQKFTGSWKTVVLPFSVRWQVGDAVGNMLNAWIRGDIPPSQLSQYISIASRLQLDPLLEETQPVGGFLSGARTRRRLIIGEELEGYARNPLLQEFQARGLQQSGRKAADIAAMTEGTKYQTTGQFEGRILRGTRQSAFRFNEFQNRLARQAVALKYLDDSMRQQGIQLFEIVNGEMVVNPVVLSRQSLDANPALESAIVDAVQKANDVLGAFSELSPFERKTMRTIFPFWSWMKFINMAAMELLIDQPDRVVFMAHLGSMTLEEQSEGLWDWLRGKTPFMGSYYDLSFLNPYSDAVPLTWNRAGGAFSALVEEGESVSPVIGLGLLGLGEAAYSASGTRPRYLPTFSRPGYLEGRPGETTRTLRDTLGGLGYATLKSFGGPVRNALEWSPVDFRIPGTDVAVGYPGLPRFPQGSLRTTGPYGARRLSPTAGRVSALLRTFGVPAPIVDVDVAERAARENLQRSRELARRRLKQRRLAQR